MKPSRIQAIADGKFIECLLVTRHAKLDIRCDSCCFEMDFFNRIPKLTGLNSYEGTVKVLKRFMDVLPVIIGGTVTAQFKVDAPEAFWVRIRASDEDSGRTLTFSLGDAK